VCHRAQAEAVKIPRGGPLLHYRPDVMSRRGRHDPTPAVVLGDVDLVAALGRGGIRSTVVTPPRDPARFSRWTAGWTELPDLWGRPDAVVAALLEIAASAPVRPVLYYESDADLLALVHGRQALEQAFHLVLADSELVLDTVDKARFADLAARTGLPVPPSWCLRSTDAVDDVVGATRFPLLVKPLSRRWLELLGTTGKAVLVDSRDELRRRHEAWGTAGVDVLVQQLVPGAETQVESYHAYLDAEGHVAGEFTGVKLRTSPPAFGHSSSVCTTDAPDVRALGREVAQRLGVRGVLKVDVKRDEDGRLWVLEVNLRFTLWHHLGAVGGTNLPALVHADLTGRPRPPVRAVPAGLVWTQPVADLRAALQAGVGWRPWLRTFATADARSGLGNGDVQPFLRGLLLPALGRRLRHPTPAVPPPDEALLPRGG
jgi:D-aspartate ligase